ncbi:MAG: glycosyltransferase [Paracoccus sp. (in: a-proteobacteria)]|nr:glycosyltransferase [Paracoccus sp. (in: a-proteobacteria)]
MTVTAAVFRQKPPKFVMRGPESERAAPPARAEIAPTLAPRDLRPLGQILLEDGAVTEAHLFKATILRRRENVPLGEILLAQGWVTEAALTRALSRQWRASFIDPVATPGDPRLIDQMGPGFCLTHAALPWRRVGGVTFIATARPTAFEAMRAALPPGFGPVRMLLATQTQIHAAIMASRKTRLRLLAESSVAPQMSCRTQSAARTLALAAVVGALAVAGLIAAPVLLASLLTLWAALTLLTAIVLRLMAFASTLSLRRERTAETRLIAAGTKPAPEMTGQLPVISVMVPLFHESDVAGKLVARLSRLSYPRELTDILLVVEESDEITRGALEGVRLPHWLRVVTVPPGPVQTKPRALNYAMNFCRGQIVGVWDAEDRPDPDQLHKVARRFAEAPADVACLQGVLDYYNPRTNWLARCFTIEYASWYRANLPGIARMGLVVPLGGTTLFFRREVLEDVGAWDAWNVTEDADLGVRLARLGYRTEIIDTVTLEEANCRALPWVKQRSRWLKGYAMTWAVHMRRPRALLRDLGPKRFIGFQVQFFGTMSQYLLAPVLWSFWLLTLGLPHPLREPLTQSAGIAAMFALMVLFVASEILNIVIGMWAVRGREHRHLIAWVPTMHFYFPLGCLAAWKAIYEVVAKPFYWDKTAHGVFDETEQSASPEAAGSGTEMAPGESPQSLPLLGTIDAENRYPAIEAAAGAARPVPLSRQGNSTQRASA